MKMMQKLKKAAVLACVLALVLSLLPQFASAASDARPGAYVPPLASWERECSTTGESSVFIRDDGTVVIQNYGANVFTLTQSAPVKPNTDYCFSALVWMEDYRQCGDSASGASVRYGSAYRSESYINDFVTSPGWRRSSVYFTTGEQTTEKISLAVGVWGGACEGTAYFRDMVLEEVRTDNHWNMLALIYTDVETPEYSGSFSESSVRKIKAVLNGYPEAVDSLSDGRMIIDRVDIRIVDEPISSVSGDKGNLTYGPGQDIDFEKYLESGDYNLVAVYAPIGEHPKNGGSWRGMSGGYYSYRGRRIFDLIISGVDDYYRKPFHFRGRDYDQDTASLLHETLHSVETNSILFNNWSGFTPVHDNLKHGYTYSTEYEYLHWYSALMRDVGLNGRGFKPRSFFVRHLPDSQLPGYSPAPEDTPAPEPAPKDRPNPFSDISDTAYYFDAVLWAYDNNVTKGTGGTKFSPRNNCTRGQMMTFLWRAMGKPAPHTSENPFADVPENAFYRDAVLWAVEQGITNGTGTDRKTGKALFSPEDSCSYAHIVTFLWRCCTGKSASSYGNWYSEPLDWAGDGALLLGTPLGDDAGRAADDCPRCDVVTFLYRAAGQAVLPEG